MSSERLYNHKAVSFSLYSAFVLPAGRARRRHHAWKIAYALAIGGGAFIRTPDRRKSVYPFSIV
jgi:hypothetical protein